MNRIAIISIYDLQNFGNRLQNYAAIKILSQYGDVKNLVSYYNDVDSSFFQHKRFRKWVKILLDFKNHSFQKYILRRKNFQKFDSKILSTRRFGRYYNYQNLDKQYDFFFVGSDQIWNRWLFPTKGEIAFAGFTQPNKCVAFMPSICMDRLTNEQEQEIVHYLKNYKALSCREREGSRLLNKVLKRNVETLIDPTLLLDASEWSSIAKKPTFHNADCQYILMYFLGKKSADINSYITTVAQQFKLKIIDLLDSNSEYYTCGPMEFVYLIKHCKIMFTDSFHGSVFSYIFDKPFKNFVRSDIGEKMNSRIDNLLETLHIVSATVNNFDSIDETIFDVDYDKQILKSEQCRVKEYLNGIFGK